jgi:inorganic pyrophosphatase
MKLATRPESSNGKAINLSGLPARDKKKDLWNFIVETPRGSHNKFKYLPEHGLFGLHRVLPTGSVFPFDFGFVPSTKAEDGDPIDVLVLMEDAVFPGCLVPGRLIGVIEAKQTEDGKTKRNDRLLGVAQCSRLHADVRNIKELDDRLLTEIEHFFKSYDEMEKKVFKPIGRRGPGRAAKLIRRALS